MKIIDDKELKQIQLDILSAVDQFCAEHNIKYSLADGTLLGAVRHKGYIPWDDDIDVVMLREDYNKFEKEFPTVYNGHYRIASLYREKKWYRAYPNVYDDRTVFKENAHCGEHGVSIDVFPLDDVPEIPFLWKLYYKKLSLFFGMLTIKTLIWSKNRSIIKNLFITFLKVLICWMPIRRLTLICDKIAQSNNEKGYTQVYECSFGPYGLRSFNKSVFDKTADIEFEGRYFKAFENYDEFLTKTYGDYMTPPPVDKQVSHHEYIAYWKNE